MADERLKQEYSPLIEKAVRSDGTIGLKVIGSGWGSSGYYSPDVLERDIPTAFPPGTFMYWNHPTATEEAERPEGDLSNLAAILTSTPKWQENGKQGAGVYADAKVFGGYKEAIDEIGEHIGVSIRGRGKSSMGEADGKEGRIIEEVTDGLSVDFVTSPGAGGAIIQVFEAAADNKPLPDVTEAADTADDEHIQENDMEDELKEAKNQLTEAAATIAERDATIAKLQERLLLQEAQTFVAEALAKAELPDMTRDRLAKQLQSNPPIADGKINEADYTVQIETAVKEAQAEIAAITGGNGQITGQGSTATPQGPNLEEAMKRQNAALAELGYGGSK
jgi:hypothetical protein